MLNKELSYFYLDNLQALMMIEFYRVHGKSVRHSMPAFDNAWAEFLLSKFDYTTLVSLSSKLGPKFDLDSLRERKRERERRYRTCIL